MPKRAAIYVRVSTDKQTVENQLHELRQIAERAAGELCRSIRMPASPAQKVGRRDPA
jgi:hypothetical protein